MKKAIKNILLVCTGNSCRSIMAEGYLRKRLNDIGLGNIGITSAGTGALPGLAPTQEAIEVLKNFSIDISTYKSKVLDKRMIEEADIILIMAPEHKTRILDIAPSAAFKIQPLRGFTSEAVKEDLIPDPIGRHVDFYKIVFNMIKDGIEGFLKWLKV